MRAYFQNSYLVKTLIYLIVLQLFIGALPQQLLAANDKEHIPPIILHVPVKTAMEGENIFITAALADQSGIKEVQLKFKPKGQKKFTTVDMNKLSDKGVIKILITAEKAKIFSEDNEKSRVISIAKKKDEFFTKEGKAIKGFYHIKLDDQKEGWVAVNQAKPTLTGDFYLGMIPASETYTTYVNYKITAKDVYDNPMRTPAFKIMIVKKKKDKAKKQPPKHSSFWGSRWFWGGLVGLSAGTAYYFKYVKKEKEKKGNLNFEISW